MCKAVKQDCLKPSFLKCLNAETPQEPGSFHNSNVRPSSPRDLPGFIAFDSLSTSSIWKTSVLISGCVSNMGSYVCVCVGVWVWVWVWVQ